MEATKILTANFLDILFEGRNKDYGAYELRNTYEKRMWKAMIITTGIFLVVAGSVYLETSLFKDSTEKVRIITDVTIMDIKPQEKKADPPKLPDPPKVAPPPKVKTIALVTPTVVKDIEVKEPPPTQTDVAQAKISNVTQAGVNDIGIVAPPQVIDGDRGIIPVKKPEIEENIIEREVTIEASYLGGTGAWRSFLERNLRGDVPVQNGAEPKNYTVIIQFVVDKDGSLSDIKALTKIGFGMEDEAIRVIKKSGKWRPAILNGKEVKAYRKQPITFQVLEQ